MFSRLILIKFMELSDISSILELNVILQYIMFYCFFGIYHFIFGNNPKLITLFNLKFNLKVI